MPNTESELNEEFSNEFNIPPPTESSSKEGNRFLNDFRVEFEKRRIEARNRILESEGRALENKTHLNEEEIRTNERVKRFQRRVDEWTALEIERESQVQPPLWYQRDREEQNRTLNFLMSGMADLQRTINTMQGTMNTMQGTVNTMQENMINFTNKVNTLDMRSVRAENRDLRKGAYVISPVPFINGNNPDPDLPPITSVQDVDRLSRSQCSRYLQGYGVTFHVNETTGMKKKLASAVGLSAEYDREYPFSGFPN